MAIDDVHPNQVDDPAVFRVRAAAPLSPHARRVVIPYWRFLERRAWRAQIATHFDAVASMLPSAASASRHAPLADEGFPWRT